MRRARLGVAVVACLAFAAIPAAAEAAPVNLATVAPFVVLGGQTVTNTGPSVLNGALGVSPGTALPGFGLPAVVNGATHANDAVAARAQLDLTTAYDVAAGQAQTADLSNTDLGNRILTAGAYRYTGAALLTGPLTLDAQGDPNAQFVFMIGAQLTTASASSVVLINGASPCNVFWQVGSSATLGSTTAFQGNLMALTSISLQNAATVLGRMLARNGQVSLINNVLSAPNCATGATTPGAGTSPASRGGTRPVGGRPGAASPAGTATLRRTTVRRGTPLPRTTPTGPCTAGFRAIVRGRMIRRVVFSLDSKRIASRVTSPFQVLVRSLPGVHRITARVTFTDTTRPRTLSFGYRACAVAERHPPTGPAHFTG
jgi:hypothetical protein